MKARFFAVGCGTFLLSFYKENKEDRKTLQIIGITLALASLSLLLFE